MRLPSIPPFNVVAPLNRYLRIEPRRFFVLLTFISVGLAVPGALRLEVEQDVSEVFTNQPTEDGQNYQRFLNLFRADKGAVIVLVGGTRNEGWWTDLLEFIEALRDLDVVEHVEALATVDHVHGRGDTVEVGSFLDLGALGPELIPRALDYPPYRGVLISESGEALAVYVRARQDVESVDFNGPLMEVVENYRRRFEGAGGRKVVVGGEMRVSAEIARLIPLNSALILVCALIMLVVTGFFSRSIRVGVLGVSVGTLSAFLTFALMGYLGVPQTANNAFVVMLLVPLGAASALHANAYVQHDSERYLGFIPRSSTGPFLFATGTTMIVFGVTAISSQRDVQQFGLFGVFGIGVCTALTFALTFPLLKRKSAPTPTMTPQEVPALLRPALRMGPLPAAALALGLGGVCAYGATQIEIAFGPVDYLMADNPVRRDFKEVNEHFSAFAAPFVVFGNEPNDALNPDLWLTISEFVEEMEQTYPGLRAVWMYDQLSEVSQAFSANEPVPDRFPDSPELMAQYLLLFDGQDVEPYLDWNRTSLAAMFQLPFRNSREFRPFRDDTRQFVAEHSLDGGLVGRIPLFFDAADRVARENLQSIAISGVVIFIVLLWMFRSFVVSLVALFVNLLPVVGGLAYLAFQKIPLDLPISFAAAIALGLVVDDTGHMLARYNRLRMTGRDPEESARRSVAELWRPIATTTVTVVVGFLVLNLGTLRGYHTFSWLLCVSMGLALFGDLMLLPALLRHFDRRPTARPATSSNSRLQ